MKNIKKNSLLTKQKIHKQINFKIKTTCLAKVMKASCFLSVAVFLFCFQDKLSFNYFNTKSGFDLKVKNGSSSKKTCEHNELEPWKSVFNKTRSSKEIKLLVNSYGYQSAHIYSPPHGTTAINIKMPQPYIFIREKDLIINKKGVVYKSCRKSPGIELRINNGLSFLGKSIKSNSLSATDLLKNIEKTNSRVTYLFYTDHRGFGAFFKETKTKIIFGYPPFEKKVGRSLKIIKNFKTKKQKLLKIEIDFLSKAFIKKGNTI